MHDKHSKVHAELARQIRLAKQRMFRRHREGEPLESAGTGFLSDVSSILNDLSRPGVVQVHDGEQSPPVENPIRAREDLADAISEVLTNDLAPPRLRDAVRDYVTDAPTSPTPVPPHAFPEAPPEREPLPGGGYERLTDAEVDYICEMLGDNSSGRVFTGWLIALLHHLFAVAYENEDLELEISGIATRLVQSDCYAMDTALEDLLSHSRAAMDRAIQDLKREDAALSSTGGGEQ